MEARRDLAVRDDGPRLTDNDWLAAMQAGFRRPVDETIRDPVIDAPALGLKDRDDLGFGALMRSTRSVGGSSPGHIINPSPMEFRLT